MLSTRSTGSRWRWLAVAAALVAPLALGSGPATAVDPGDDPPPVVTSVLVSPTVLPASGGPVTISVQAHDDLGGITAVYADVTSWEGGSFGLQLPFSGSGWSGTVDIPPNYGEYDINYVVTVYVHDVTSFTEATADINVIGTPPFDEVPMVWNPSISPTSLPHTGGAVALAVSAWDLRGISEALVVVTPPAGAATVLPLDPVDLPDRFAASFTAPANTTATPKTYSVQMTAYDDIGQGTTIDAGSFTVARRPAVVAGTLSASPSKLTFGQVAAGTAKRKTLEIRRSASRSSVPITGFVAATGPGFVVVGAGPDGLPFSLLPGKKKTVIIEYRPTAVGDQQGVLLVRRADGGQSTLKAVLRGKGGKPKR